MPTIVLYSIGRRYAVWNLAQNTNPCTKQLLWSILEYCKYQRWQIRKDESQKTFKGLILLERLNRMLKALIIFRIFYII